MDTLDVTCPECGATPGVGCRISTWGSIKRAKSHQARAEVAADWRRLAELGEILGIGKSPDLDEAEHLSRFGDDDERPLAAKLVVLAEQLGYREPGDEEAA